MTLATFEELLANPAILTAASELVPTEAAFLGNFEKLRKRFPAELAKAALETVILRAKAASKFPQAATMFFLRESLEQATHHLVAAHRAKRFAGFKTVLDLGCGVGGDAIALAQAGCDVIAVERDPLRARIAEVNFKSLGVKARVIVADALTDELPKADAIFCDPARRDGEKRHLATDGYEPLPREIIARFPGIPIGFKFAPGIPWSDLGRFEGEAEFVSLNGELKECRLWLGSLKTCTRRATLLPSGATISGEESFERETREPGEYLYLPDAAVIRAGLDHLVAAELHAGFLDAGQPLLTSDVFTTTPLATAYRTDALIVGAISHLTAALRERNVGRVTFINIGSPREVEAVRKSVKLKGDQHRAVILTKINDAAAALIVEAFPK